MNELKLAEYFTDAKEDDDIEISQWFKKPGETFTADEPVVEVLIGKAETEVCLGKDGKLEEIICDEGEIVTINDVIGKIS